MQVPLDLLKSLNLLDVRLNLLATKTVGILIWNLIRPNFWPSFMTTCLTKFGLHLDVTCGVR